MQRLKFNGNEIPKAELLKAVVSWLWVLFLYFWAILVTPLVAIPIVLTARPMKVHPQGQLLFEIHRQKYVAEGSSGTWQYINSPLKWLAWWNNYEDGLLGEPSGRWSATRKGKERSLLSMYLWIIRNPFNVGKRTLSLFHCPINSCTVEYWGVKELSDKGAALYGEYLCKATHIVSNRVYYGYRYVQPANTGIVKQAVYGFKIKPVHGEQVQDADDLDKAFTFRFPVSTRVD